MKIRDAVIVDAVRTAVGRGKPSGVLSGVHSAVLSALVLKARAERNELGRSSTTGRVP